MISWCCDSAGEELDRRDRWPSSSRSDDLLELSGEARASVEPCQRSFDHPAPEQHHEALCGIGLLEDLDSLFVDPVQRLLQLVTRATTIGKGLAQPLEAIADRGQQQRMVEREPQAVVVPQAEPAPYSRGRQKTRWQHTPWQAAGQQLT